MHITFYEITYKQYYFGTMCRKYFAFGKLSHTHFLYKIPHRFRFLSHFFAGNPRLVKLRILQDFPQRTKLYLDFHPSPSDRGI